MCCRYYYDESTMKDILDTVKYVDDKINCKTGDIRPTDSSVIIAGNNSKLVAKEMKWGINTTYSKQLLINARAETVRSKAIFSKGIEQSRCLIPAKHFYEWDAQKEKVTFSSKSNEILYMAGFYLPYEDGDHFVILTTAANHCMRPVHDRMPLILSKNDASDWIFNDQSLNRFLSSASPELRTHREYEQLSFYFL